jgi:Flp pilus assembly protein TadG
MASVKRLERRWLAEDGAELVEFALVLPLLLLMLLGIIDFGMLFQRYQVITNAAREGARLAVLPGYSDADVETRVEQFLTAGGLDVAQSTTTVDPPQQLAVGAQCIMVRPVTVEYQFLEDTMVGSLAPIFGGSTFSRSGLSATASMRSETAAGACP